MSDYLDALVDFVDGTRLAGHCEVMAGRIHASALAVDEAADMRGFAGSPGI